MELESKTPFILTLQQNYIIVIIVDAGMFIAIFSDGRYSNEHYEKPVVLANEELAERVYAASGAVGSNSNNGNYRRGCDSQYVAGFTSTIRVVGKTLSRNIMVVWDARYIVRNVEDCRSIRHMWMGRQAMMRTTADGCLHGRARDLLRIVW